MKKKFEHTCAWFFYKIFFYLHVHALLNKHYIKWITLIIRTTVSPNHKNNVNIMKTIGQKYSKVSYRTFKISVIRSLHFFLKKNLIHSFEVILVHIHYRTCESCILSLYSMICLTRTWSSPTRGSMPGGTPSIAPGCSIHFLISIFKKNRQNRIRGKGQVSQQQH